MDGSPAGIPSIATPSFCHGNAMTNSLYLPPEHIHEKGGAGYGIVLAHTLVRRLSTGGPATPLMNSTDTIASLRRARKPCLSETEDQKKEVASHEDVTHHRHRGAGTLGDAPWSAAGALYWAEVDLEAPATEGSYDWNVKLPKPDLELAHEGSAYPFAFVTASPPDHVVTVEVIDKDSKTPLSKAFVTLHSSGGFPYRNRTDDAGVARVSVPKGEYRVYVLKEDCKDSQTTAAIASDVTIKAELLFAPDLGG